MTARPLPAGVSTAWDAYRMVGEPMALGQIREPGVSLCWWKRALDPRVIAFMAAQQVMMPRQRLFRLPHDAPLESAVQAQLDGFMDTRWYGYAAWREDVLAMIALARQVSRGDVLRVRLESVASNGCRLFHTDLVPLRLITTYRGPGTEWLPAWAVDPTASSRHDNQHVLDMSVLQRLGAGDVALMKGDRYPGQQAPGLMHRSPPSGPQSPRIVLAIDLD